MEKHSKLINFIKSVIIIALAVVIVTGALNILILKCEDGINQFDALYKHPDNTIDVFFLGSSHVYCDIATGVLWDNYGLATFDLGGAEAPAWVSYYQLKEALRYQHPKLVCFEVSVADEILFQNDKWSVDNNYGMNWNSNRIEQLRVNSEGDDFYVRLNPYNIMHGRYKDLQENDFRNVRNTVNYKGFDPREVVIEEETPDMSEVTDTEPCPEKVEEYVRATIQLCKSEGIPIVLFISPYGVEEHEQRIYNYLGEVAKSEGVEFWDFNRRYDEIGLDFSVDISDGSHLSYTGNYKYSDYLGKLISEKFDIPDRRGDKLYKSWDWDSAIQRNERNDLAINESKDATEILTMTGSGYIVFGTNEGSGMIIDDGAIVKSSENGFRLTYSSGTDNFLFLDETHNNEHTVSLFINDTEYKEEYGNILFVYDSVKHEFVRSIRY
ncbi:MAG: hypothetical protein IKQ40_06740 [Lachnospiraceae bacterium]|nr:hypothetical protein [Lachnospiraceae bacterium]